MADFTLHLHSPAEEFVPVLMQTLQEEGFQATVSFNLEATRAEQTECVCPHHGNNPCTCQYIVLLVSEKDAERPAFCPLILYGRDAQVWLNLPEPHAQMSSAPGELTALTDRVQHLLQKTFPQYYPETG